MRKTAKLGWLGNLALGAAASLHASPALADEPRSAEEPVPFQESTELTRIVDAFDLGNDFDLHLSLGYGFTQEKAAIRREAGGALNSNGTTKTIRVATYTRQVHRLEPRADFGIYHDLGLIVRMPIVLQDERYLSPASGTTYSRANQGAPGTGTGTSEVLFPLDHRGPVRSGIEYLALGLDLGLMSQVRSPSYPTWTLGGEVRLDISEPTHACNKHPGFVAQADPNAAAQQQVQCAYAADIDRDGVSDNVTDAPFNGHQVPGVSRGTTGLELHSYMSKRIKYVEPYGGIHALYEIPNAGSDLDAMNVRGAVVQRPPVEGSLLAGISVIPWEVRSEAKRVVFDFRYTGTYRSEGVDYSELYDALGSSDAASLRIPQYRRYAADPNNTDQSVADLTSGRAHFNGVTTVQENLQHKLGMEFTWQAGQYVRFKLGGSWAVTQSHLITGNQSCDGSINDGTAAAGRCRTAADVATGVPNPNYRTTIDAPGRRYLVRDVQTVDGWVRLILMF